MLRARGPARADHMLNTALDFDPTRWKPVTALRCTVGVALPLLLALVSGHAEWGVLAGVGALNAGFASLSGPYRARWRLMLTSSVGMAAVTLLAGLVGSSAVASALAVTAVAGVLTVIGASGAAAGTVALQATNVLIILSGLPLGAAQAPGGALLVLAGGVLQTLLLGGAARLDPVFPERWAVARAYRSLADFVTSPRADRVRLPGAVPFQEAWTALEDARRLGGHPDHARLQAALQHAEDLRNALVGPLPAGAAETLHRIFLDVAHDLRRGHPVRQDPQALRTLERWVAHSAPDGAEQARWARIVGLLRELAALPTASPGPIPALPEAAPPARPLPDRVRQTLATLRPDSLVAGYALRYAVALGVTTAAYRLGHLPHGYWLPLTVAVVLKPEYALTLTRGVARLVGTLGGVLVATLLTLLHPPLAALMLLVVLSAWLGFSLLPAGYAPFSFAVTLYVVFSLTASGMAEQAVGAERIAATGLGGLIALGTALLWPRWRSREVREALRAAAAAQQAYARQLEAVLRGGPPDSLVEAQRQARSRRVQAGQVLRAASLEPRWHRDPRAAEARDALEQLDAGAAVLLPLHTRALGPGVNAEPGPALEQVREILDRAGALAEAWSETASWEDRPPR
ncbi:FUSC family protein [Deinococcus apachensis]|uniref:FUSC family protein n=1 Tax=Deinococcus apachensis TaxID=309886 RepID=UPI0003A2E323|nr:FUSC family protein [Deinococcus apachensis]